MAARAGYGIARGVVDARRRKWAYAVIPSSESGGGTITYHASLAHAIRRIEWALTVQGWQRESLAE